MLIRTHTVPCRWREESGIVRFAVTSDGLTGPQWNERLRTKGVHVSPLVTKVLLSPQFKVTPRGATVEVVVLKGTIFESGQRVTHGIRTAGRRLLYGTPVADLACLIRDKFTDDEIGRMDLSGIVTMHEPISCEGRKGMLLQSHRMEAGPHLMVCDCRQRSGLDSRKGFAFVEPLR